MSNENAGDTVRLKTTGVYGADLVPGTYLRTKTGAVRGEELFSRPDLERPWRSVDAQKRATAIALKEKEIEELLRLCSNLRTELGNAKNDSRFLEFALTEKMKAAVAEKDAAIAELESKNEKLTKDLASAKEDMEHQIRLLKSQHENELLGTKREAAQATERCTELTKAYQKQVADIRAACTREIQFVESRFSSRVDELTAELRAARETASSAEQHYVEQTTANNNMLSRVEADCKERLRTSEQRMDELRKSHDRELVKERTAKEEALSDARRAKEKLAVSLVDTDEVAQRFKTWNNYLLAGLDKFYENFVAAVPNLAVEPVDPQLHEVPSIYAPRVILEEPEAKVTLERVAYRVLQLKKITDYSKLQDYAATLEGQSGPASAGRGDASSLEYKMTRVLERQERLKAAMRETSEKVANSDVTMNNILGRLYFFSDSLASALANAPASVEPPLKNVVFVCLSIANGESLWADNADVMRTAVTLMENSVRLKMAQYGAYECYSDATSMMLAFGDAAAACRFCTECQEWLVRTPWPSALLKNPFCRKVMEGDKALFAGLRVGMAMHAGECFVEPSGMLTEGGAYRAHYYGRAVSQMLHITSLAQGGQVLITKPAWALCLQRRHELGQLVVTELGSFPIMSFNTQTACQEKQSLDLYQVSPKALRDRAFKPTSKMDLPSVSSLAGAKRSILLAEIDVVESRRSVLKDALSLVSEEYKAVQEEMTTLVARCRSNQSKFHLLPPPEMVSQMNDLYGVMEKVAIRAEEIRSDLSRMSRAQEEMEAQLRGLRDYYRQQSARESREDELRTELDVSNQRIDNTIRDLSAQHRREMSKLQDALHERDQMIRKLCQRIDN